MSIYNLEKKILRNQLLHMVGKVWLFPEVTYSTDAEGEVGVSMEELKRLQLAVANYLCGNASYLTGEEFDFLSELTETTAKEMTDILGCSHTNFSKWRAKNRVPFLESIVLKEVFWMKLFGGKIDFPKQIFGKARLASMAHAAISAKLVQPVDKKVA